MIQGNYGYLKLQKSGLSTIGAVTHKSTTVLDSATQAEIFNELFNSTFIRSSFTLSNADGLPFLERHLSKVEICSSDVSTALGELDPSKALGSDIFLQLCSRTAVLYLSPSLIC